MNYQEITPIVVTNEVQMADVIMKHICGKIVALDKRATLDIAIAMADLHGRYCEQVNKCGDMFEADEYAGCLPYISAVYKELDDTVKLFDDTESK